MHRAHLMHRRVIHECSCEVTDRDEEKNEFNDEENYARIFDIGVLVRTTSMLPSMRPTMSWFQIVW